MATDYGLPSYLRYNYPQGLDLLTYGVKKPNLSELGREGADLGSPGVLPKKKSSGAGLLSYIPYVGPVLGGLAGLGEALGLFGGGLSDEQKYQDERRRAALEYLQANAPDFQRPNYQFDPNQYQDILQPLGQQEAQQNLGLRNTLALQGRGRGGALPDLMNRQQQGQLQNRSNLYSQLARQGEEDAYRQAIQEYQMKLDKAKLLASYQ